MIIPPPGIVIFGAPGSVISGNTIVAATRGALGGINAVDYNPWGGTFKDVVVESNTFHAAGAMIKVGIAIGGMTWGSDNRTAARTYGGTFRNNVFKTSGSGYFGYASLRSRSHHLDVSELTLRLPSTQLRNFGCRPHERRDQRQHGGGCELRRHEQPVVCAAHPAADSASLHLRPVHDSGHKHAGQLLRGANRLCHLPSRRRHRYHRSPACDGYDALRLA